MLNAHLYRFLEVISKKWGSTQKVTWLMYFANFFGSLLTVSNFLSSAFCILIITSEHHPFNFYNMQEEKKLRIKHAETYHILQGRLSCFGSLKRFTREKKKIKKIYIYLKTISNFQSNKTIEKWEQIILLKCGILDEMDLSLLHFTISNSKDSFLNKLPSVTSEFLELHSLTANILPLKQ